MTGYVTVDVDDLRAVVDALTTDESFSVRALAPRVMRLAMHVKSHDVIHDRDGDNAALVQQVELWARE